MEILIILPNNLGDIIMALPAVNGLKTKYHTSNITFFVEKGFEAALINNPNISEIFIFDRSSAKLNSEKNIDFLLSHISELLNKKFEYLFNLSQHEYTAYLSEIIHADKKYGRKFLREGNFAIEDIWSQYLYAIPFARKCNKLHVSDIYRRICGVENEICSFSINLSENEINKSKEYLLSKIDNFTDKNLVFFQPGTAFPAKRWDKENFIKLGKLLVSDGYFIVISGASSEQNLAENIANKIGSNAVSTAGETSFREAISNLTFANFLVTADTALMHAAAALNIQTLSLFGATNPVETGPYGNQHKVITGVCKDSQCFKKECSAMSCMNNILPEDIFSIINNNFLNISPNISIFHTEKSGIKDIKLKSINKNNYSLYNSTYAKLSKSIFTKNDLTYNDVDIKNIRVIISQMGKLLSDYLINHDTSNLKHFELKKSELEQIGNIAIFFAAFLNIRLNSVPLIDPIAAVTQSRDICYDTVKLMG